MLGCDKAEIERHDVKFKAFAAIRGTSPYFQQEKLKLLAYIRQLGPPNLFMTLSAAESKWKDLLKGLLQKESGHVINDEVDNLSESEIHKLLDRNPVDVNFHFDHRIKAIFAALNKPGILSEYRVKDFYYRTEFQQRGAPHIHSVLWLVDKDGNPPPNYDGSDGSKMECAAFIDSVICGQLPDKDDALYEKISEMQTHGHRATCRKNQRKLRVRANEGHGKFDNEMTGPEIILESCRFKFPKFPSKETVIIDAPEPDTDKDTLKQWKDDYRKVRTYLLRQTFEKSDDFFKHSYDEFLDAIGLTHLHYMNCLRIAVSSGRSSGMVVLKRDCKDLFTNNYNRLLTQTHQANHDISFVLDQYSLINYILGYITKAEAGLSKLLQMIDDESAKFGRTPGQKMRAFSNAIDINREVSRPEAIYRMCGFHMCQGTRQHKFIQAGHPSKREGRLRSGLEDLEKGDNPFCNTPYDYYMNRPDDLEDLSILEFQRDYNIVYLSRQESDENNVFDSPEDQCDKGVGPAINLKNNIGKIRKKI